MFSTYGHSLFMSQRFMHAKLFGRQPISDDSSAAVRYSLIIFVSPVLCDWIDRGRY